MTKMNWITYHTKELKEKYLLKFLPIARIEDFLKRGELWFSRADEFGDNLECITVSDLLNKPLDFNKIEKRQKRSLVSCWHLADTESVAMWDTYSESTEKRKSVAIRFKRENLIKYLETNFSQNYISASEFIHGKVQYKNLINYNENRLSKAKVKYAVFRKENAFSYESEYRLVIQGNESYKINGFGYKIGQPELLDFDILINPLLQNELVYELKERICNSGFKIHIKESQLRIWFQ